MKKIKLFFAALLLAGSTYAQMPAEMTAALKADDNVALAKLLTPDNLKACYGNYSLLHNAVRTNAPKCFALLLEKGADVNKICNSYVPPLVHAVVYGRLEMVKALVAKGADTKFTYTSEEEGFTDMTLIGYAERNKRTEVAEYLRSLAK